MIWTAIVLTDSGKYASKIFVGHNDENIAWQFISEEIRNGDLICLIRGRHEGVFNPSPNGIGSVAEEKWHDFQ